MKIHKIASIKIIFLLILLSSIINEKSLAQKDLEQKKLPLNKEISKKTLIEVDIDKISDKDNLNKEKKKDNVNRGNFAIVQALNKTTGKTSVLELKVGDKTSFGTINILTHKCIQSPLDQKPENKILLEIFERKNDGSDKANEQRIFYGWMFSSSPSISGLEHPIYDIIAINCKNK